MNAPKNASPPRRQTVSRILRQARARRDPSDIAGFDATLKRRHNSCGAAGLTQAEVADLAGVSRRWYRELERGIPQNYSEPFLQAVRRLLALTDREWDTLRRLTGRTRSLGEGQADSEALRSDLPHSLFRFVHAQRWPAYLCDRRWDVIAYNEPAAEDFPWMTVGTNVMIWALTYPEARTQLINWQADWAMPMIAQLHLHAEQWSADPRVRHLIEEVCADPTARALWNSAELPTPPLPKVDTPRRLYLPRHGTREFEINLLNMRPLDISSLQFMTLIPTEASEGSTKPR